MVGKHVSVEKTCLLSNQIRCDYLSLIFIMIILIQVAASLDEPIITIDLKDNIDVQNTTLDIEGNISKELSNETFMWLIVSRNSTPQFGWPQGRIVPMDGKWDAQALFSEIGTAFGENEKFDISAILVNRTDNQYFSRHLNEEIMIPEGLVSHCSKTVNLNMPLEK